MALRELLLPWDSQPQEIAFAIAGLRLHTPVTNPATSDYITRATADGLVWDAQVSSRSIDLQTPATETIYGFLIVFELTQAAITSSTSRNSFLCNTANSSTAAGLNLGAATSALTGETISLADESSNRSGISDTISIGRHVLVAQWVADRYRWTLDGVDATELHTATPIGLQAGSNLRYFCGRLGASEPRICPALIALSTAPGVDLRRYAQEPWQLFEPRRIFVPVSAGGGGGAALQSTATVTASASASLTTAIPLAASATASASASAALTTGIALAASASASASASGALTTSIRLAASASCSVTATADLSTSPAGLSATASVGVTATAALTTGIRLATAATAQAQASAALTTAIRLQAAAAASVTATGDLTSASATALAAAAIVSAQASAALTTAIALRAVAQAQCTAVGVLEANAEPLSASPIGHRLSTAGRVPRLSATARLPRTSSTTR